jgi:O-antigen ligase
MSIEHELRSVKYISGGLALITLFVYTSQISDPVNAPKFLLMGLTSFLAISLLLIPNAREVIGKFKPIFYTAGFMVFFMCVSVAKSQSPFSENIYGVQGRNTGFLNHIALLGILLAILGITNLKSLRILFSGLLIAGLGNIAYCLWVLIFGDFIGWNNPYKSLLGTLGNPNFASSFLAITTSGFIGYVFTQKNSVTQKIIYISLISIVVFEIVKTNSTQGLVVLLVGAYLTSLFYLHLKIKKKVYTLLWAICGFTLAIFGVAGLSNQGPLARILYQETLAFRWQYWSAGIKMGIKFPLTGVGMDSYGDWYRQLRTAKSVIEPGVNVVTNVSHNVYIDAFANGGIPLLISYLVFSGLAVKSILRILRNTHGLDPLFVGISVAWLSFQLQSLISINQIGISIWGWALTGMLIVYPSTINVYSHKEKTRFKNFSSRNGFVSILSPIFVTVASLLAFLLYSPPLLADHKWTVAYSHKNAEELVAAMKGAYFSPSNSMKYLQAIQLFENSNRPEQAHQFALQATKFNPRSFDAWQMLYKIENSTVAEKKLALQEMIYLDPRNVELRKLSE